MRLEDAVRERDRDLTRLRTGTRPMRVAIVGFGTVGRAVARLLRELAPAELQLSVIVNRSVQRKRVDWVDPAVRWTDDITDAFVDNVDLVVELIGGRSPAEDWIRRALRAGKSVVTANKQVIAHAGPELLDEAARLGRHLRFEAAVAGGVPVVRAIGQGLAGDSLMRVAGILNGTCNYVLSRMERERVAFGDALADAQALGFAEADPSQDVQGLDAQAKLAILAHIAFGVHVRASAIDTRSVDVIDAVDFAYAAQMGCTIRQVAWAERTHDSGVLRAGVGPALVAVESALARVRGSENLVVLQGRFGGETTFGGLGAGGDPTAVAVVSDLLAIARDGSRPIVRPSLPRAEVSSDCTSAYYVRFTVADRPGIIAALSAVFERHAINIDAILQQPGFPAGRRPFVVTLEPCHASAMNQAMIDMSQLDFHGEPPVVLPMFSTASMGVLA